MIDRDLPEKIKDALDIVDVIGEVIPLTKRGSNYFGLSPFKQEKSPSFCVNPSSQFYFCFSTNQGGDMFSFVQKYYGWDFPQALEELAKRAGIEVTKSKGNDRQKDQLEICERAAVFFEETLYSDKGEPAREYLEKRKIPERMWKDFRLGYHAGGYQDFVSKLEKAELSLELASQLGLIGRTKTGSWADRFRSRLIFPIADERGRIRGFGGRAMGDEQPKYLNSPASSLFDKKRLLYGMHLASEHCRKKDYAILCEGYLDVISLHEYGVKNSVGSMGTALTQEQVRSLKRRSQRLISLYDADAAGLLATERNLESFLLEGITAKVAINPDSKDPDALLHDESLTEEAKRKKLKSLFSEARPALDYLIKTKILSESDPIKRAKKLRSFVGVLDKVPDPVERRMLKQEISKRFELPVELLLGDEPEFVQQRPKQGPRGPNKRIESSWDREILKFLVKWGREKDFDLTSLSGYLSFSSKWSNILGEIVQDSKTASFIASLSWLDEQDEETRKEVGRWVMNEDDKLTQFDLELTWAGLVKKLRTNYFQGENLRLQGEITQAEQAGQNERLRELLMEKQDLVRVMKED